MEPDIDSPERLVPGRMTPAAAEPGEAGHHNNLGNLLTTLERLDEAERCYLRALALRPGHANAHNNLAMVLRRLGRLDEAATHCDKALELEPANAENWYNFACLKVLEGDRPGAAESLDKALTLDYQRVYGLASKDPRVSPILDSLLEAGTE